MINDWLGNELNVGDLITYSSTSTLTGMNLAEITKIDDNKIQLQLWHITRRASGASYMPAKRITLHSNTSAYKSITRYLGKVPERTTE